MHPEHDPETPAWKHDGVCVVPGGQLDPNTAQTPGMDRKAAINQARVGAQKSCVEAVENFLHARFERRWDFHRLQQPAPELRAR